MRSSTMGGCLSLFLILGIAVTLAGLVDGNLALGIGGGVFLMLTLLAAMGVSKINRQMDAEEAEARRRDEQIRLELEYRQLEAARAAEERQHIDAQQAKLRYYLNRYGDDERFAWREAPARLTLFARQKSQEFFVKEVDIIEAYDLFHEDVAFIEFLRSDYPALYQRVDEVVNYRCLELARQPEQSPEEAPRRPLSPEEKDERVRSFRARALQRVLTKIDDNTAEAFVAYEAVEAALNAREAKIREIHDREDLSDAEKDERIRAVRAITEIRLKQLCGDGLPASGTFGTSTAGAPPQSPSDLPPPVVLDE
jgi:hypothetical protein